MTRRAHQPTEATRVKVTAHAMTGVAHHELAVLMDLSTKTLLKHYRKELDYGKAQGVARVTGKLFALCMAGDKAMIAFYMKCQGGWRETQKVEHTGADGAPLAPPSVTVNFPKFLKG
jgi:hypothetical protein